MMRGRLVNLAGDTAHLPMGVERLEVVLQVREIASGQDLPVHIAVPVVELLESLDCMMTLMVDKPRRAGVVNAAGGLKDGLG